MLLVGLIFSAHFAISIRGTAKCLVFINKNYQWCFSLISFEILNLVSIAQAFLKRIQLNFVAVVLANGSKISNQ